MKVHLYITLKNSIRDYKADTIATMINRELSLSSPISNMKIGKYITFDVEKKDKSQIESIIKKTCDELLVDAISEQYEYKIEEDE